jgi:hypothetical protein
VPVPWRLRTANLPRRSLLAPDIEPDLMSLTKLGPAMGVCGLCCVLAVPAAATAGNNASATLRGSQASMERQHSVALGEKYSFLRTRADIDRTVADGQLVPVTGNGDYELANVSFPFTLPEVRLFIERLGAEYREVCGEPLTVTSLMRPTTRQPRNASRLSVHPTGMAVDLRLPGRPECRGWLEGRLLELEAADLLDVTRERRPPHYHVALFPASYRAYVDSLVEAEQVALEAARQDSIAAAEPEARLHAPRLAAVGTPGGSSSVWLYAALATLPMMLLAAWQRRARRRNPER